MKVVRRELDDDTREVAEVMEREGSATTVREVTGAWRGEPGSSSLVRFCMKYSEIFSERDPQSIIFPTEINLQSP
jgi:hypothetical protein